MICYKRTCVFHKNNNGCIVPPDKNFLVLDDEGVVEHCINDISFTKDLSKEGKERLKKWKAEK